jgi:hypothetical protein
MILADGNKLELAIWDGAIIFSARLILFFVFLSELLLLFELLLIVSPRLSSHLALGAEVSASLSLKDREVGLYS